MLRDGFCPLVWTLTECDWCLKSSERILRRLLGKVCAAKRDPKRRRLEDKVVLGKIAIAISLDPLTVEFGCGERGIDRIRLRWKLMDRHMRSECKLLRDWY